MKVEVREVTPKAQVLPVYRANSDTYSNIKFTVSSRRFADIDPLNWNQRKEAIFSIKTR